MIDDSVGFELVRILQAPPEQVWTAWTDAETAARWWHPRGMHTPRESVAIDAREGGRYQYTMVFDGADEDRADEDRADEDRADEDRADGGKDRAPTNPSSRDTIVTAGVYRIVAPHERLEFTWGDPDAHPDDTPLVTILLERVEAGTRMTFGLTGVEGSAGDGSFYDGWEQALDSLKEYLASQVAASASGRGGEAHDASDTTFEVRATREFPAPVTETYAAWTLEEGVRAWWGPTGFTCPIAEMDVRVGGVSLVAMRAPAEYGGGDIYNTWSYSRVDAPYRLDYVVRFATSDGGEVTPQQVGIGEGVPNGVPHVVTFESAPRGSRVTVVESGYTSAHARDLSRAGMEQCLDKLERLLSNVTA
jgi:uncharacterized protein YndB with AHSA1/START domain